MSRARLSVPQSAAQRWLGLAGAFLLIGVLWLVVLPYFGSQPALHSAIRRQELQGINPSATYYTELEAMHGVLNRMEGARRQNPNGLWVPSRGSKW